MLDNSPHSKEALSGIRQASTPIAKKRSTNLTTRQAVPTREGKREADKAHGVFAMTTFAPEEFFGGGQICNDELPSKNSKNVDFDCIMKAFFDERNKYRVTFGSYRSQKVTTQSRTELLFSDCDVSPANFSFGTAFSSGLGTEKYYIEITRKISD